MKSERIIMRVYLMAALYKTLTAISFDLQKDNNVNIWQPGT